VLQDRMMGGGGIVKKGTNLKKEDAALSPNWGSRRHWDEP